MNELSPALPNLTEGEPGEVRPLLVEIIQIAARFGGKDFLRRRFGHEAQALGAFAQGGFIAYFGTFDVDESTQTVIHHVQACLVPSWVGTDLKRTYRFNASRLVLTAVTTSVIELI
jgi:hypothetical protein